MSKNIKTGTYQKKKKVKFKLFLSFLVSKNKKTEKKIHIFDLTIDVIERNTRGLEDIKFIQ